MVSSSLYSQGRHSVLTAIAYILIDRDIASYLEGIIIFLKVCTASTEEYVVVLS